MPRPVRPHYPRYARATPALRAGGGSAWHALSYTASKVFGELRDELGIIVSPHLAKGRVVLSEFGNRNLELFFAREERGAESDAALSLTEARGGNNADTRGLKQRKCVHVVGRRACGLGGLDRSLRHVRDTRKGVHGTVCRLALDTRDGVQSPHQKLRTPLEAVKDRCLLGCVTFERRSSLRRPADHERSEDLPWDARAKTG
mmetsp:Transcript_89348/g.255135  ORF Transcript_89348/g.255135 Transcript_89348/m.255135 type:complete len:202 (+) Transcript_89348:98-703(+)